MRSTAQAASGTAEVSSGQEPLISAIKSPKFAVQPLIGAILVGSAAVLAKSTTLPAFLAVSGIGILSWTRIVRQPVGLGVAAVCDSRSRILGVLGLLILVAGQYAYFYRDFARFLIADYPENDILRLAAGRIRGSAP